jgi:hypothetical protein
MAYDRRRDKGRLPAFVPLFKETLDASAWRALSHGARSLYVALKRRHSDRLGNNGHVHLSLREAAEELNSHRDQIARWFRELQHFGFIAMTEAARLGVNGKGKAPHWRLTELSWNGNQPTRDFHRWNGVRFEDNSKTESRPGKQGHSGLESGAIGVPENGATFGNKWPGKRGHTDGNRWPGKEGHS